MPGAESYLLEALQAGATGCISASCNVNAPAIRQLYDEFQSGRPGLVMQQDRLTAVRKILQLRPLIPVMKHMIADGLGDPSWRSVRPPLLPLPDVEAAALESELRAFGWQLPAG